ncbi:MAG: hypothetical protein V2I43_01265 [Parvularcula sp.]|jgi:hypothetical protein|nr:hypothetical protein [Parvularcula sp.]
MADDKHDHPEKIPFKNASAEQEKIAFERSEEFTREITNPDGSPLRDKDNAHPTLRPAYATRPQPNLAPGGTKGIRTRLATRTPDPEPTEDIRFLPKFEQNGLAVDHGIEVDTTLYTEGRVLTMPGYDFVVRISEEPRQDGIDGGKIDQLVLKRDGATVARYNHGWKVEPATAEHREALHRVRTGLDDAPAKRITAPEHDMSKGRDIEH